MVLYYLSYMTTLGDKPDTWIRDHLEALEEEILSAYIARAQFARNKGAYSIGYPGNPEQSLFDAFLLGIEEVNARFGRYMDPLERPFNQNLPDSERSTDIQDRGLKIPNYDSASVTHEIKKDYLKFLDVICRPGDDKEHGSSAEHDITALLVTSQRIHSGMIVAEWKYGMDTEEYDSLIITGNEAGLMDALTDTQKEGQVIDRVRSKAQQRKDAANPKVRHVIEPYDFAEYFRGTIIPLTKKVEVRYFMNRTQTQTS